MTERPGRRASVTSTTPPQNVTPRTSQTSDPQQAGSTGPIHERRPSVHAPMAAAEPKATSPSTETASGRLDVRTRAGAVTRPEPKNDFDSNLGENAQGPITPDIRDLVGEFLGTTGKPGIGKGASVSDHGAATFRQGHLTKKLIYFNFLLTISHNE
jgi:hypothetical protein